MNHCKFLSLTNFLILFTFQINAQKFSNIYFEKLPQDLQLYPRNPENESYVDIKGVVEQNSVSKISILVFRNGELFNYLDENPYFERNQQVFYLRTKIKAELAEYDFHIYSHQNNGDSTLIVKRINIVSGDVFLITGQSNSYNGALNSEGKLKDELYKGKFARSFGVFNNPDNFKDYNPADTLWNYSNINNAVGMWGTELQKLIIEKYEIPVCIINGGSGGSSSEYNALRDPNNPMALNTTYGRLLYRVKKAGVGYAIKGFFYRQGENEADGATLSWKGNFAKIYKNLNLDLYVQKIYLFQNNIYTFPNKLSGVLREHQRIMQTQYNNVTVFATVGTEGYDGIHYDSKGYIQTANEVFRVVEEDFYEKQVDQNAKSPNIQFAHFADGKTEVVLQFESGQEMIFDTINQKFEESLKQFFILDDGSFPVSISTNYNKVYLKLNRESHANTISFMPAFIKEGELGFPNYDNLLYNKLNMRPLTFENFPISFSTQAPEIKAVKIDNNVLINCNKLDGFEGYRIQYRHAGEVEFGNIIVLNEKQISNFLFRFESFVDNFKYDMSIDIRMFAFNYNGIQSDFSNIVHIDFHLDAPVIKAAKGINENEVELTLKQPLDPELKYIVEYSSLYNSGRDTVKIFSVNKMQIKGLWQGSKYNFKVRTVNPEKALFSKFSEFFEAYTHLAIPDGFSVTNKTSNGVTLNWQYNEIYSIIFKHNGGTFEIEQSSDGINFEKIPEKTTKEYSVNINNLLEATPYFFRLIAKIDNKVKSKYSEHLKIITLPASPTNLNFKNILFDKTQLVWKDNSNGEKAYQVFQKTGEIFEKIAEIGPNSTEFMIEQLKPSTKYYFKVAAIGEGGMSEFSEIISAETSSLTSNEPENLEKNISIFPNPSSEVLNFKSDINLPKKAKLKIFSANGKLILEKIYPNLLKGIHYPVLISDLNVGMYLLEIQHDKGKIVKKFIKN